MPEMREVDVLKYTAGEKYRNTIWTSWGIPFSSMLFASLCFVNVVIDVVCFLLFHYVNSCYSSLQANVLRMSHLSWGA